MNPVARLAPQPRETSAAICYRMQPAKRMLTPDRCSCDCNFALQAVPSQVPPCLLSEQQHTVIDLEPVHRVAMMITPQVQGSVMDQAWEAISTLRVILSQQPVEVTLTMQTVFVRDAEDVEPFRKLFMAYFGRRMPPTNFIVQPPCGGQALAIEAWALGGAGVAFQQPSPDAMTVAYDGLRWTYIAGIESPRGVCSAYEQTQEVFSKLSQRLRLCGARFFDVPRVWIYQGGITANDSVPTREPIERYREMNRARTDFFDEQRSRGLMKTSGSGHVIYPASTGIGVGDRDVTLSCLALQTERPDVRLVALENPRQTSAFDYAHRFSPKSPKFSRAMAVVIGDVVTTWISGTASILDSETVHVGDVEKQTQQAIDNIEQLIGHENFRRHGLSGPGANLSDLAKVRVYVKHQKDFERVREACQIRFGTLPAIYAQADVCRSNLLVEIEGVTFSRLH